MIDYSIGCDNAAVDLKNTLIAFLRDRGITVTDFGCYSSTDSENYPSIAKKVCEDIIASGYKKRGILVCGTGMGMAISANKFKGIRAAVCHDNFSAERFALSNDGNVLCMGARIIGSELAKKVLAEWVGLSYIDGPSTSKIQEIIDIEEINIR